MMRTGWIDTVLQQFKQHTTGLACLLCVDATERQSSSVKTELNYPKIVI